MRRHWGCWVIAVGCLVPQLGCLSAAHRTDTAALTGSSPDGGKDPVNLPDTESVRLCLLTAEEYAKAGKFREAALEYERARQFNPNQKNIAHHLAPLYDRLGMPAQAQAEFDKALLESPRDANLCNNYGFFLYGRQQWQPAEEQFRKALALDSKLQAAWTNLGLALARQERYAESLEAFQKVVSPAEAYCNLALVQTVAGKIDLAKQNYHKALDLDPTQARARSVLAKMDASAAAAQKQVPPGSAVASTAGAAGAESPSAQMPDAVLPANSDDLHTPRRLSQ
jgi:Tfp pilus assembly protein PilF